jgi:hypothetical protein
VLVLFQTHQVGAGSQLIQDLRYHRQQGLSSERALVAGAQVLVANNTTAYVPS